MSCDLCRGVVEQANSPHVLRSCAGCGRALRIVEPGDHGKGIRVQKGDRLVIPAGWFKMSANPLTSTGHFSRFGLEWFIKQVFIGDVLKTIGDYDVEAAALEKHVDSILDNSPLIQPLNVNDPEDVPRIAEIVQTKPDSKEFWAFWTGHLLATAREARVSNEMNQAIWATACAERCRLMLVYKDTLEEVVWMGHSAQRIVDVLRIWDANKEQDDEEFWQLTLSEHSYVMSQVFAVPVIFIREKAYVGGMKIDRNDAKFVDYLLSAESSREAILIEIKTPTTKLLGGRYRKGVYAPSRELVGATVQMLAYRAELARNVESLTHGTDLALRAFNPKCVLVVGNAKTQLTNEDKRRSFELFRMSSGVEIVTYDELFRKVEILAELFNLKRTTANSKH